MEVSRKLAFGYNQFLVHDKSEWNVSFHWTDTHLKQGFARHESVASFSTLKQYGEADLRVFLSPYTEHASYDRVIAVPFVLRSGELLVEGPEEVLLTETLSMPPGNYRLITAQYAQPIEQLEIDLENPESFELGIDVFLEKTEKLPDSSVILVCDQLLDPPTPLIELTQRDGV